jgi:hypothetical protein
MPMVGKRIMLFPMQHKKRRVRVLSHPRIPKVERRARREKEHIYHSALYECETKEHTLIKDNAVMHLYCNLSLSALLLSGVKLITLSLAKIFEAIYSKYNL